MLPLTSSSRTTLVPKEKRVVALAVHTALATRLNIITIYFSPCIYYYSPGGPVSPPEDGFYSLATLLIENIEHP